MGADEICIYTECTGAVRADQHSTFALWDALYEAQADNRAYMRAGEGRARNRALAASQADWVFFLDADDLLLERALAEMRLVIEAHPTLDMCFAPECETDQGPRWRYMDWVEAMDAVAEGRMPSVPVNLLVRRQAVLDVGGYDEALSWGCERDMALRLVARGSGFAGSVDSTWVKVRSALSSRKHPGYAVDPGPFTARIKEGYYR